MPLKTRFYSPSLSPDLVPSGVDSTQDVVSQSDASFGFSLAQTTRLSPLTGLGIIYPTDQSGFLDDSERFMYDYELSYPYNSLESQRRRLTPVDFLYNLVETSSLPEDPAIEPLRLSSVLNSDQFSNEEEPVVPNDSHDAMIEMPSVSDSSTRSVRRNGSWDLQKTLETTVDTLLTEPSAVFPVSKESAPCDAHVDAQPADPCIEPIYFPRPFVPPEARSYRLVNPSNIAEHHTDVKRSLPSWPQQHSDEVLSRYETLDKVCSPRLDTLDKISSLQGISGNIHSRLHATSGTVPSSPHMIPDNDPASLLETSNKVLADAEGSQSELKSCIERIKKEDVPLEIRFSSPAPLTKRNLRQLEKINETCKKEESDYEPSVSYDASTQDYIPSPRLLKHNRRTQPSRPTKRNKVKVGSVGSEVQDMQPDKGVSNQQALSDLPINHGTPVLNAHRGISLDELKAKAARYRMRNPGKDYDKQWLLSFAGKLTPKGKVMEDFRCYVIGCSQTNKRRDHIVIHVGAHLNHRPFACEHCGARFLRRNECKRHEFSHSGLRPYKCDLCLPDSAKAFVRQDLLKRHQLRTHRVGNCGTSKRPSSKKHG